MVCFFPCGPFAFLSLPLPSVPSLRAVPYRRVGAEPCRERNKKKRKEIDTVYRNASLLPSRPLPFGPGPAQRIITMDNLLKI